MKKHVRIILSAALLASIPLTTASADLFGTLNKIGTAVEKAQEVKQKVDQAQEVLQTIDRAAEPITQQDSYFIGRTVASNVLTDYKLYNDAKAVAYLNKICKAITMNSDTPKIYKDYCVSIIDSDEINALSTSGGHIFITTGVLKCCSSEDEVAAIIAHEIAHIHLEHAVVAIKTARTTDAIAKSATMAKDYTKQYGNLNQDEKNSVDFLTKANIAAMNLITETGYTKGQEFDADKKAISLMTDAGYDPNALVDVLTMIKEKSGDSKEGWSKTHPKPDERIKKAKTILAKFTFAGASREVRQARFERALAGIR
ncbi:MAG: M48 family metalloprotease [Treponema sp.]|nr:M48 family metalloprotease [Treponema sp.]